LKAKCIDLIYEPGWRSSSQNTKKRDIKYEKGCFHWDNGNGWQENFKTSKLTLIVEVEKEKYDIWIDKFFKSRSIRLVDSIREKLKNSMPDVVNVIKTVSPRGTIYYKVSEFDLEKWLRTGIDDKKYYKKDFIFDEKTIILRLKSIKNNVQNTIIYEDDYVETISKNNSKYFYNNKRKTFGEIKEIIINNIIRHGNVIQMELAHIEEDIDY
jgi:hypothetical protein